MEQNTALAKFKHIKLERTICYGSCPVYTVEIFSDGMVHFFGDNFVEQAGHHIWKIDSVSIDMLNHAIKQYGFFIMIEGKSPWSHVRDAPSCITSILLEDGTFREITHNMEHMYPQSLRTFENKIEWIIKDEKYIGKEK